MDGWVGGWVGGWMDGWMDGWNQALENLKFASLFQSIFVLKSCFFIGESF